MDWLKRLWSRVRRDGEALEDATPGVPAPPRGEVVQPALVRRRDGFLYSIDLQGIVIESDPTTDAFQEVGNLTHVPEPGFLYFIDALGNLRREYGADPVLQRAERLTNDDGTPLDNSIYGVHYAFRTVLAIQRYPEPDEFQVEPTGVQISPRDGHNHAVSMSGDVIAWECGTRSQPEVLLAAAVERDSTWSYFVSPAGKVLRFRRASSGPP